VESPNEHNDLI